MRLLDVLADGIGVLHFIMLGHTLAEVEAEKLVYTMADSV